ncbi:30S ribosomal protein S13 [Candidatus Kaiserbacteria bacterium RIFCSPHIGHO2_01_FULL_48_10]|uniref:Small ribosomal subunit protein uS13 n=1 Tax=Candidatus Kaiserbacteria bacterium RIFCSPHIGHO2_01_FULL_48_10 TaxID=1798476 RepID=A0A1F6C2A9_9BACT|nr:MAG: 30S ribosomal protein S13 [Candidatus Kaiserbacteria bacterium RIFCSPHIGHO2_01_FULL_48_10]
MRISGITLPDKKHIVFALTAIYGIGHSRAEEIIAQSGVSATKKAKDLTTEEENKLRSLIEKFTIEGDLRREVSGNIKRLKDIKAYRGTRHMKGLPSRGQRTKTNSRTVRGNVRKTMGSGRRKLEKT